jgi:hypothetical protein
MHNIRLFYNVENEVMDGSQTNFQNYQPTFPILGDETPMDQIHFGGQTAINRKIRPPRGLEFLGFLAPTGDDL